MVRLLLFRHAKSSWDDPALDDAARPLSPRGKRAADTMGRLIEDSGFVPDLVLVSPAKRARHTLEIARKSWSREPVIRTSDTLYQRMDRDYLTLLQREGGDIGSIMLVAHNPATEKTAAMLAGVGDDALRDRLHEKFPTGAVAIIDFPTDRWSEIGPGLGQLVAFLRPRDA